MPSLEEHRQGCTNWRFFDKKLDYMVSHHGVSDYKPLGIWCYYVFFHSHRFLNPKDWMTSGCGDVRPSIIENYGRFHEHISYENVDFNFHGGATYGKYEEYLERNSGQKYVALKIGCDFSHLWDEERDYPYNLQIIRDMAERSIDEFVSKYPQKECCRWSGIYDVPENFYKAVNGHMVHKSCLDRLKQDGYDKWTPMNDDHNN